VEALEAGARTARVGQRGHNADLREARLVDLIVAGLAVADHVHHNVLGFHTNNTNELGWLEQHTRDRLEAKGQPKSKAWHGNRSKRSPRTTKRTDSAYAFELGTPRSRQLAHVNLPATQRTMERQRSSAEALS
jgi:hypothetical protein